jgi:hypothetical protein
MVITDPHANERRRAKEAIIRVIDMVVYLFALASGIFALAVPPDTIKEQLTGFEWLGVAWGTLLIVAGFLGFLGRLSRYWVIEVPGTVAAIAGQAVYILVLAVTAPGSPTAWVALCMIIGAALALIRRYIELQIFTTDPEVKTLVERLESALQRRTTDTAGQHR